MTGYSVHVQIHDPFAGKVDERALRRAAEQALITAGAATPAALTVVITDTRAIQTLHAQHMGDDSPTDVLSYPADEDPATREPGQPPYLGDVLIALPVAEEQARTAGHSTQEEVHLLAVHGVLHLLGYDHQTPEDEREMWAAQSAALAALREAPG